MIQLTLIIVSGLPGVGKSTLSEGISRKLKLPILSVDPIESAIIKSGATKSFKTGLAAYLVAEQLASEHLKLGISVVIDAVSPVKEGRQFWNNLSKKFKVPLTIIECILDKKLHQKRVEKRVRKLHGISELTWDDVELWRGKYLAWEEDRLVIDTTNSIESNLAKALKYIKQP